MHYCGARLVATEIRIKKSFYQGSGCRAISEERMWLKSQNAGKQIWGKLIVTVDGQRAWTSGWTGVYN